jgi:hypothetical protein
MSDTYHYDEGAIHNDHKRVIHIDTIGGAAGGNLFSCCAKFCKKRKHYGCVTMWHTIVVFLQSKTKR